MRQELIDLLHEGQHSLVVERDTVVSTFGTKGIATLLQMVNGGSDALRGAIVVDKVVGKAAAALMVLGGVVELHALLISDGALSLLSGTGIKVSYDKRTDHIVNRDGTDWCPMEKACRDCLTAGECLERILNVQKQLYKQNEK